MKDLRSVNVSLKLTPREVEELDKAMARMQERLKSGEIAYRVIANRSDFIRYALEMAIFRF